MKTKIDPWTGEPVSSSTLEHQTDDELFDGFERDHELSQRDEELEKELNRGRAEELELMLEEERAAAFAIDDE